jgi:hypothetical protein
MHAHKFRGGSCLPCGVQPSRTEYHLLVLRINLHYIVILIIYGENKISIGLNDLCPDIELNLYFSPVPL